MFYLSLYLFGHMVIFGRLDLSLWYRPGAGIDPFFSHHFSSFRLWKAEYDVKKTEEKVFTPTNTELVLTE